MKTSYNFCEKSVNLNVLTFKKQLFLSFVMLLLLSCTASKSTSEENENWFIQFEKGGCLDVCKSYTISIKNNGEFNYNGKFKVKHLGSKKGVLKPNELVRLNDLLSIIKWEDVESDFGLNANNSQLKVLQYSTKTIKKKTSSKRISYTIS